jgi:hypothetical protein
MVDGVHACHMCNKLRERSTDILHNEATKGGTIDYEVVEVSKGHVIE